MSGAAWEMLVLLEGPIEDLDFEVSSLIGAYFIGGKSFNLDSTRLAVHFSSNSSGSESRSGLCWTSPWR